MPDCDRPQRQVLRRGTALRVTARRYRQRAAREPAPRRHGEPVGEPPTPVASGTAPASVATRDPTPVLDAGLVPTPATSSLAAPKASWAERLKAGLGLSRDKLSGAIQGA